MTLSIRKMQQSDIPQVQHIAKTAWHATYEGIIPLHIQNNFLDTAYNEARLLQRLESSIMHVAQYEGSVCGFANYSKVNDEGLCELVAIYLLPSVQGKGIGSALLQQAIQDFNGLKEIHVNVEQANTIGMNFYLAKGFKIVKQFEEDFEGHILHTVRMVLEV